MRGGKQKSGAALPAEIAPTYVFLPRRIRGFYTGEIFSPTGRVSSR